MDIKQSLIANNSWWNDEKINPKFLLGRKREEFSSIIEKLNEKRILSIIGPRRVGKSTLIYQTINYLLEDIKVEPKRILFFSGDDPSLFFNDDDKLSDVLDIYFKEILSETMSNLSSKVYVFIDEIHFIKSWQNFLKTYFDKKYDIKFIVTGSSSVHLYKDANESLLGRIENIYVLPLTFNQFLNFHQTYISKKEDIIIPKFDLNNPQDSFKSLDELYYNENLKLKVQKILKEYILVGGYPEYFENTDIAIWHKRLADDIIIRGIYKDILAIYNIKSPEILEKIMYYISSNNSQTFSYTDMSKIFAIDTTTLIAYIGYLKQAFLINVIENYSSNMGKIIRTNKKMSIVDNGIQNSFLKRVDIDDDTTGHIVEGMTVFDIRLLCERENYVQYYYRNTNQEEVDIILNRKRDLIPVEVKYVNTIDLRDVKNIKKFIETNNERLIGKTNYRNNNYKGFIFAEK
ncbi:MAG: ATP-binding protein [Oscillospiraceae bacterium]|nr:ATP-binding protein [Oscillospiraceae bacterium]